MSTAEPLQFKSIVEIEAVKRQYRKNCFFFAWLGASTVFGLATIDVLFEIFANKRPITNWLSQSNNTWFAGAAVVILLTLAERTDYFRRTVTETGRRNLLIRKYEKAQAEVDMGIQRNSEKIIKRGLSRLESVEVFFSMLPEYDMKLLKGRECLKSIEEQNA